MYLGRLQALRGGWEPQDYSDRLLVPDRRIAVVSDVHIPYHDEELLAQLLHRCSEHHIEAVVWLGDLMDVPTFSRYGLTDQSTSFIRELEIARGVIEVMSEVVPVQYWSKGNHEQRWMKKLENQVYMDQLGRMAGLSTLIDTGTLLLSDNPTLDAFDGTWMLTHPAQYGSVPLSVPAALARKFRQNIMSGHAHHYGQAVADGFVVVETGGLFDPRLHAYIQHGVTTHKQWCQGYWFLIDGVATGYQKEAI